ncbi:acyl-CoA dehydrogenase family protein [Oceanobacillus sp. CF4.6]|uniref:acyl-CoA dehydrogenase family protein n=1 Tax=Oceanobacillus sp. CF4.6 TaxID=3373080 RepID=UPI003EE7F1DC
MDFNYSEKTKELQAKLTGFMDEYVYEAEIIYEQQLNEGESRWNIPPIIDELKEKARKQGLWNLFLPEAHNPYGLTNQEYAPLAEIMGRSLIAPEIFNCNAPDTGNMEVFLKYGTEEQKNEWLKPLLDGKIRSAFAMTEPDVASSDATNIECSIERDGDEYIINGRKWWTTNGVDPRTKIIIVMGKTEPEADRHKQQSMVLVPMDTPGVKMERPLSIYGYDHAPTGHAEISFNNVRVPVENILLGEGRGFEIAQGRLGPGRVHHCMRAIGAAERALELMCKRAESRETFGKKLSEQGVIREYIADSRIDIEQARLLTLKTAFIMDEQDNKAARKEIAMIKVAVPKMCQEVIDRAVQVHGAGGVSQVTPLAEHWANARTLRLVDGPDEVHRRDIGRLELRQYQGK